MIWENFKSQFDKSWWPRMRKFIESEECDRIYKFLKEESKRGVQIAPLSLNTFRCFLETPLDDVKVIILSYCPYHSFTVHQEPIADGLAFSCSITEKLQPSLLCWYEGLENDLYNGLNLYYYKYPSLLNLAKQGVLLLNSSLTVEMNKPGSHSLIWENFTKWILEEILIDLGVPIVLIGKDAQRFDTPPFQDVFEIEHPAFAAREQRIWNTEKTFTKVNKILMENNRYSIDWLNVNENKEIPF